MDALAEIEGYEVEHKREDELCCNLGAQVEACKLKLVEMQEAAAREQLLKQQALVEAARGHASASRAASDIPF